jgi:hypothetical protein
VKRAALAMLVATLLCAQPVLAEPISEEIYAEGQQFGQYFTHQHPGDDLILTSGALVASDAFIIFDAQPAERTLEPGQYPVTYTLAIDGQGDVVVAYARVEIALGQAVIFEPATSFGVQSGIAAFLDQDAVNRARADYNPYGDAVLGALTYAVEHNEYWTAVVVDPETGADAVVVTAGHGDGDYATYWGYDENGDLVTLVADFNVLSP